MARGKSIASAKAEMPVPEQEIDVPARAEHALTKKTLIKEWGLKPWELDRLRVSDLQDVALAEHTQAFIDHEQHQQAQGGGMRSTRNSEAYRDYEDQMTEQFGGVQ